MSALALCKACATGRSAIRGRRARPARVFASASPSPATIASLAKRWWKRAMRAWRARISMPATATRPTGRGGGRDRPAVAAPERGRQTGARECTGGRSGAGTVSVRRLAAPRGSGLFPRCVDAAHASAPRSIPHRCGADRGSGALLGRALRQRGLARAPRHRGGGGPDLALERRRAALDGFAVRRCHGAGPSRPFRKSRGRKFFLLRSGSAEPIAGCCTG